MSLKAEHQIRSNQKGTICIAGVEHRFQRQFADADKEKVLMSLDGNSAQMYSLAVIGQSAEWQSVGEVEAEKQRYAYLEG